MSEIDYTPAQSPFDGQILETAFASIKDELSQLKPEEVLPVNLDILAAVTTAAGVIPEIKALRPRMVAEMPQLNQAAIDKLAQYAMAASFAHTAHLVATRPQDHLSTIYNEAAQVREVLVTDANALAKRGLIPAESLASLKGSIGFKNVQADLQMLVHIFKGHWSTISGKCAVTELELERASKLVSWLIQAVGLKEQGPAVAAQSLDDRNRAFTLFMRAYNEARRAVSFLRWNSADVDAIIPSLYAGRGGRKKEESEPTAESGATTPDAATLPSANSGAGVPPLAPVTNGANHAALSGPGGPFMS